MEVHPYTWNRNSPTERRGMKLVDGTFWLWLPLDEAHAFADRIVDEAERQERKQGAR